MSTLIVGGAGYIGSHFAHALTDRGDKIVILDDLSTGQVALLPPGVTFIRGDLGDMELVGRLIEEFEVDVIANFAARIVVEESVSNPLEYYETNTAKARSLVSASIQGGVKHFIFSSTAAVYGDGDGFPITENALTIPISPYGRSKLATEWILSDAAKAADVSYVIFRYFNVAGADPNLRTGQSSPNATHLIKLALNAALGLRPNLTVFGTDYPTPDGTCVRDYIHVADLANAHVLATDYLRFGGKSNIFNCAYGHGSSVLQVIDRVKSVTGTDFPVLFSGRRNGDPASLVADGSAIRSELGWQPKYAELDLIIRHALAWEKQQLAKYL
jgi:UDP-glucose 4-epimerase